MTTLGEIAALVDCEHKTAPVDPDGEYFAVGTPAMKRNVIDLREARRISEATFVAWTRRMRPRGGDLLFAREAPVGPVVRIPDRANVAPGQRTVLIRANAERADERYLFYLISSPLVQARILTRAAGSTVPHLNVSDVRTLELGHIPTLDVQRAIAKVLGALDAKIAANQRVRDGAGSLGRELVRAAPLRSARLGDVADVVMGTSPRGDQLHLESRGLPFFQGVRDFGPLFPAERVFTEHPIRTAEAGSVLLAVRAPVGEINLAISRTAIGRGLAAISSEMQPAGLYFALAAFASIWDEHQGGGTVFASVNGAEVRSALLPMPVDGDGSLEVRLQWLLDRAVAAENESRRLAATRDELLPLLMSGRITVKDAEQRVEGEV